MHFVLIFNRAKLPDNNYGVDGVMDELVKYDRGSEYAAKGFSDTVSENVGIVVKSTRTLLRTISLLKLPPEIQAEIRSGISLFPPGGVSLGGQPRLS